MKRIFVYFLVFVLLSAIPIWANRDFNRTTYKKTVNRYWAGSVGEDSDPNGGPVTAETRVEVDIDYEDENAWNYFWGLNRIVYESNAKVTGEGYAGHYSITASAAGDYDSDSNRWEGKVKERVRAKDIENYAYTEHRYAIDYFGSVSASADVNGSRSHPAPTSYSADGDASNFSWSSDIAWRCYLSGDTSCSSCN